MRRPRRRFQRRLPFLIVDVLLRVIILALLASATGISFSLPSAANAQYVVPRILVSSPKATTKKEEEIDMLQ